MRVIGITGGVGTGKSAVLNYLSGHTDCRVIAADRVAHELEEPGGICHDRIVELLGKEILSENGGIDRHRMAEVIFKDRELLAQVNAIVHPAVKEYITGTIAEERDKGSVEYLFLEAALLIEGGYGQIVDELWYIHTGEKTRRERLKASRGYTDEKIDGIMKRQLSEEEFRRQCAVVIDNNGTLESVYRQIDEKLGEELWQKQ